MGWLTDLGHGVMNVARTVRDAPIIRSTPVGTAANILTTGASVFSGGNSASTGQMPTGLPSFPALPYQGTASGVPAPIATQVGTRGTFAMPDMTIDMIRQLESAGLMVGMNKLRTYFRSPVKNLVVVHPVNQQTGAVMTFALHKKLARQWGLWKPSAKPPVSAGDWHAITRANAVIKKLRHMNSEVKKVANFGSRTASRPSVAQLPGKNIIVQRRK